MAFSADEVYAIAELIKRQHGGAAVVLGSLSPRTRNAQVALYQEREVDFLVATDAIGMGLNMDVDHVAFASMSKFDGHAPRPLAATEVAQIAGRAYRTPMVHSKNLSAMVGLDVYLKLEPMQKTVGEWAEKDKSSPAYCKLKRQIVIKQAETASKAVLGRF